MRRRREPAKIYQVYTVSEDFRFFINNTGENIMGKTIDLTAADGHKFSAYVAEPSGKPKGALIVVMEIFGVNSHIKRVTDDTPGTATSRSRRHSSTACSAASTSAIRRRTSKSVAESCRR